MKSGANIFALALAGALVSASVPLHSAEAGSTSKMKPLMAVSLEAGDKRILSYFLNEEGVCRLTLMIDGAYGNQPSRIVASIASNRSAKFDAIDGKTLKFSCENGAQAMSVTTLDHLALRTDAE